jgi:hypothetical protein
MIMNGTATVLRKGKMGIISGIFGRWFAFSSDCGNVIVDPVIGDVIIFYADFPTQFGRTYGRERFSDKGELAQLHYTHEAVFQQLAETDTACLDLHHMQEIQVPNRTRTDRLTAQQILLLILPWATEDHPINFLLDQILRCRLFQLDCG